MRRGVLFSTTVITVCLVIVMIIKSTRERPDALLIGPENPPASTVTHPVVVYGMRKFPFPYNAMLAISPDADHQTVRKFIMIHEFLNTRRTTTLGTGLGLDVADSFFPYNASDVPTPIDINRLSIRHEMSYFDATSPRLRNANLIHESIRLGWIDTMHSLGDFTVVNGRTRFTRSLAVQAINIFKQHGDYVSVWTNHGNRANVDDFGAYGTRPFYSYQQGANLTSPYHMTDLLIPYGIHFVWPDQPSDVFGWKSIIFPKRLPDGREVWTFSRYTNYGFTRLGIPQWNWTVDNLNSQLSIGNLMKMVRLHEYAVVATHLSANNTKQPLPKSAVCALQTLANLQREGHVLVARTSRLLSYNVTQQYIRYEVGYHGNSAIIDITAIADPVFGTHRPSLNEIRGVTFYSSNPHQIMIKLAHHPISSALLQYNKSDGICPSISIKWFPPDRNWIPA